MNVRRVATGATAVLLLAAGISALPVTAALAACGPVSIVGNSAFVVEGASITYPIDAGGCGPTDFGIEFTGAVEEFEWVIGPGQASVTVAARTDLIPEEAESITVSVRRHGMPGPDDAVTVTIGINEALPTLQMPNFNGGLCVRDGGEMPGDQILYVRLNQASPRLVEFGYTFESGTATSGRDFRAVAAGHGRIAPGAFDTTVSVTVYPDRLIERDESFTVRITSVSGATLATDRCEYRIPANRT